jgi:hypothetical protein
MPFPEQDKRPDSVEWVDEFGEKHWKDPEVDDKMAKQSLLVLQNAMKGRKVGDIQRKAAEFVAAHKAWPRMDGGNVTINVLRLEDIEKAKIKAGLVQKELAPAIDVESTDIKTD